LQLIYYIHNTHTTYQ